MTKSQARKIVDLIDEKIAESQGYPYSDKVSCKLVEALEELGENEKTDQT